MEWLIGANALADSMYPENQDDRHWLQSFGEGLGAFSSGLANQESIGEGIGQGVLNLQNHIERGREQRRQREQNRRNQRNSAFFQYASLLKPDASAAKTPKYTQYEFTADNPAIGRKKGDKVWYNAEEFHALPAERKQQLNEYKAPLPPSSSQTERMVRYVNAVKEKQIRGDPITFEEARTSAIYNQFLNNPKKQFITNPDNPGQEIMVTIPGSGVDIGEIDAGLFDEAGNPLYPLEVEAPAPVPNFLNEAEQVTPEAAVTETPTQEAPQLFTDGNEYPIQGAGSPPVASEAETGLFEEDTAPTVAPTATPPVRPPVESSEVANFLNEPQVNVPPYTGSASAPVANDNVPNFLTEGMAEPADMPEDVNIRPANPGMPESDRMLGNEIRNAVRNAIDSARTPDADAQEMDRRMEQIQRNAARRRGADVHPIAPSPEVTPEPAPVPQDTAPQYNDNSEDPADWSPAKLDKFLADNNVTSAEPSTTPQPAPEPAPQETAPTNETPPAGQKAHTTPMTVEQLSQNNIPPSEWDAEKIVRPRSLSQGERDNKINAYSALDNLMAMYNMLYDSQGNIDHTLLNILKLPTWAGKLADPRYEDYYKFANNLSALALKLRSGAAFTQVEVDMVQDLVAPTLYSRESNVKTGLFSLLRELDNRTRIGYGERHPGIPEAYFVWNNERPAQTQTTPQFNDNSPNLEDWSTDKINRNWTPESLEAELRRLRALPENQGN